MKTSQRISLIFTAILLAAVAAVMGADGVQADTACRRLVREIHQKLVPNPVSKTTLARWAEWNKTHPNFHPHARPKYKLVPEEVNKMVELACETHTPVTTAMLLPPATPHFIFDSEPPQVAPPTMPSVVETATADTPAPPFLPPYVPGPPIGLSPVPEPSSLILTLSGGALLVCGILFKRRKISGSLFS